MTHAELAVLGLLLRDRSRSHRRHAMARRPGRDAREEERPVTDPWLGKTLGRYRIVRRIGRGGMGAVYEAVQENLGRRVALKVLHGHLTEDADLVARFRREAETAAGLSHPNIVQVTDFGNAGDRGGREAAGDPAAMVGSAATPQ